MHNTIAEDIEFDTWLRRGRAGELVPWFPFRRASIEGCTGFDECWLNPSYQVLVRYIAASAQRPGLVHLSIKSTDKKAVHDWRDLQRIKNELCGTESEAIELYPAESRLVDEANQYHLWVTPEGHRFPIGLDERQVDTPAAAEAVGACQRPFAAHHTADGCMSSGVVDWSRCAAPPPAHTEPANFDPGVRRVIAWLQNLGYRTTDSGDGVSKEPSKHVLAYPHVVVQLEHPSELIDSVEEISAKIKSFKIPPIPYDEETDSYGNNPQAEGHYGAGGVALVIVSHLNDAMLPIGEELKGTVVLWDAATELQRSAAQGFAVLAPSHPEGVIYMAMTGSEDGDSTYTHSEIAVFSTVEAAREALRLWWDPQCYDHAAIEVIADLEEFRGREDDIW